MKLVLNEDGSAKVDNGHPVYADDDGVERAIDLAELHASLKTTADLRDKFQADKKAAEGRLAKYKDGDSYIDPELARRAIALERALDGKDVTELQRELAKVTGERDSLREQAAEVTESNKALKAANDDLTIGAAFRSSEWVRSTLIPAYAEHPERLIREYGDHFANEDGKIVAYRERNGDQRQPIYSKKDPSQLAGVDEALSILVTDKTLHAPQKASGGGSPPAAGGSPPASGKKWNEMSTAEKAAAVQAEAGE